MRRNLSITRKDNLNISWSKSWKIDCFQIRVYKIVPIFHEEHISFQGLILNRCAANIFLSTSFVFFIKENIYPRVSFQRITKSNWYCYVSWNIVNFFSSFFLSIERINILSLKFFQTKKYDSIDRVIIYATLNSHQPRVDPGDILGTRRKYIESGIMYSVRHVDGGIRHCNDEVPVFEVSH